MTMKTRLGILLPALVCLSLATGCNKSSTGDPNKEGRITGKASDPPAQLQADWAPANR